MPNWGGLPSIVSTLPNDVRNFLQRVNETLDGAMAGSNRFVTASELVNGGVATVDSFGNIVTTADTGTLDYTPPPSPTGLTASGAMTSILLQWDDPAFANFSYAEVWRASVDNIGVAAMIGTSTGVLYADSVDAGSSYYYWLRFVSKAGVAGQFNAIAGVVGSTSQDPAALIDILTANSLYADAPFYYQSVPIVVNGITIPVGTYIRQAYVADASISRAKIANLAVDDARIASLSVSKLTAGAIAVGQYIQSTGYVSGSAGWRINGDGSAELNNIYARGNIRATSFSAITLNANEHIKYGQTAFNTGTGFFLGDNGAGVPVFSIGQGSTGASGITWNGSVLAVKGDITGSSGNFTGTLSGASINGVTGNFSGTLSGANITGATGTFTGALSAGTVDITKLVGTTTTYTAPGTYTITVPADKTSIRVTLVGGGGGGGGGGVLYGGNGGGGGAGQTIIATFNGLVPGNTYTLIVGAAGSAGAARTAWNNYPAWTASGSGGAGGATSLVGVLSASGGAGGAGSAGQEAPASGGATGGTTGTVLGTGNGGSAVGSAGGMGAIAYNQSGASGGFGSGGGGGGGSIYGPVAPGSGGNGGSGMAVVEFFNPNGVVIRSEFSALLAALTRQGIATV